MQDGGGIKDKIIQDPVKSKEKPYIHEIPRRDPNMSTLDYYHLTLIQDKGEGNTVISNNGNVYDNTPSDNHTVTTKNPIKGKPNSSVDILDKSGNVVRRRWFGPDGNQIRDLDYTNHGNPKSHPEWPHEHGPRIK